MAWVMNCDSHISLSESSMDQILAAVGRKVPKEFHADLKLGIENSFANFVRDKNRYSLFTTRARLQTELQSFRDELIARRNSPAVLQVLRNGLINLDDGVQGDCDPHLLITRLINAIDLSLKYQYTEWELEDKQCQRPTVLCSDCQTNECLDYVAWVEDLAQ